VGFYGLFPQQERGGKDLPDNPDFIADADGNVRPVRGQSALHGSQSPPPPPESGSPGTGNYGSTGSTKGTPGGFIVIPIGLILTLIFAVLRNCGGQAQKNTYPESDVNQLNSALYQYDQGDFQMALIYFNQVISSQPEMGEAYNDRGLTYYAMGYTDKAMADFNKAIQLLPDPAVAYSNRGALYLSLANHEQALADLDKAIELSPRLAKAYHNRGLTYLDLGKNDQAIADFNQAIELTPEDIFSMQATEQSRQPAGNRLLGSGFFTGLIDRETYADLPTAYASRAKAFLNQGDYARAAEDLKKATQLGLDPDYAQQLTALLSVFTQEPQPVSIPVPLAGHWEGSSRHAGYLGLVSFDIAEDGLIHDFKLDLVFGPDNSCPVTMQDVLLQPDGTFSFTFGTPGSEGGNLIQGKFENIMVVTGSFSRHVECISTTGEYINGELSHGASWSAQWISSPALTPTENIPSGPPTSPAPGVGSGAVNITALAINPLTPSTLYAGTSAGVFKSTDDSKKWRPVNAGLPACVVNVLVIDPLSPDTLYAGTSAGLYKSTDGAESWNGLNTGPNFPDISSLVLDPLAPATIYAGTSAGVYKSMDGGRTWILLSPEVAMSPVNTLVIDPSTPATLYAGTPGGVFKTTDGWSWSAANNGLPDSYVRTLAVDPLTPLTLYAGTGMGLFKSSDGGQSWSRSWWPSPISAFALDPRSPSVIFIATPNEGMFTSTDGGANWTAIIGIQKVVYVNVLAVNTLTSDVFYAGTTDGLSRIMNGGRNWDAIDIGQPY
jgi:tetratricopeptide (TPR) repeat protein/photosystem II stability/assembly factor-like uncharacterized protein